MGDTYTTIPANERKGESTVITEDTEVLGMIGMSKLTIFPHYLDEQVCNKLVSIILSSDFLRQCTRRATWDEPRLHTLFHPRATHNKTTSCGPGYSYKDVHMKGLPLDLIQGLKAISDNFAAKLSVKEWTLGIDCIVYASGSDGIGYHTDNSQ